MARLFAQYLANFNYEKLPNSIKYLPLWVQNFAQMQCKP